ncbi:MAG: hypothetical protein ABI633_08070 [Burkholderiales bacterium]
MSDYFGALLRSAGAAPVAGSPGSLPVPDDGVVEQEFETVAGVAQPTVETSPARFAARQAEGGASAPSAPPAGVTDEDFADRHEAPASASASVANPQPAFADEVHPVVRAALEWVGADPVVIERIAPGIPRAPAVRPSNASVAQPPTPQLVAQPANVLAAEDRNDTRSARQAAPGPKAAAVAVRRPAQASSPQPASELDVDLPRVSRAMREGDVATGSSAPAPHGHVEISIGTIHVSVDAPPAARAVLQSAPPPQRVQPAATAARSAFSRARLPRS